MRRSARSKSTAQSKASAERSSSPSASELTVTLLTPSVSPTPEVPKRQYATPDAKPDGTPKRPMNAFILFSNEKRSVIADENPHLSNAAVSVLLGQRWRDMSAHEKSGFTAAAKKIKEDFHIQHPDAKTRCVSRKAKRAKLDHQGNRLLPTGRDPPSLHALALVGSRLNHPPKMNYGSPSGRGGNTRCDSASTYTQGAPSIFASRSFDRYTYDDDEYEESDDEMMHENEGGHYSGGSGGNSNMMMPRFGREEAEEDDGYDDEAYEAAEGAPSCEAPNTNGQPTLLEQLCSVAEQEHTAAAQMLSAFKQGF